MFVNIRLCIDKINNFQVGNLIFNYTVDMVKREKEFSTNVFNIMKRCRRTDF